MLHLAAPHQHLSSLAGCPNVPFLLTSVLDSTLFFEANVLIHHLRMCHAWRFPLLLPPSLSLCLPPLAFQILRIIFQLVDMHVSGAYVAVRLVLVTRMSCGWKTDLVVLDLEDLEVTFGAPRTIQPSGLANSPCHADSMHSCVLFRIGNIHHRWICLVQSTAAV